MKKQWMVLIIILVLIDQISKALTVAFLPLHQQVPLIPFFSLFSTYNEGVAFSALSNLGKWPLIIMSVVIIAFVIWLWRNLESHRSLSAFGFALVVSGALGNLMDRIRIGKVVDMISFHIDSIDFQFAIFNLADTFISLGAAALLLDEFLNWRYGKTAANKTMEK